MSRDPLLKWRSWPLIERPMASIALACFLLLLSVLLYRIAIINWAMPFFYIAGMLLVFANLLPYFIITDYELYDTEIIIRYSFIKITRKYSDFGCYYQDKRGIMLSTFKMPRRLDPFRGQSLRFSKDKSESTRLDDILTQKIGRKY